MNEREIERVAAAVMYEGYLLYPYRLSVKNVRRWTFGTVPPGGAEIRSEVLVEGSAPGAVTARIRFLQVQQRTVRRAEGERSRPSSRSKSRASSTSRGRKASSGKWSWGPLLCTGFP